MARGHEVVVSCGAEGEVARRLQAAGVRVNGVRHGVLKLRHALSFVRWLRRERPDALLLTSWRGSHWGAGAGRLLRIPRTVVRLGIVRVPSRSWITLAYRRWVDALIVNAPEIRQEWERKAGRFPPERIHLVFNGIHPVAVDRALARSRLLKELGIAEGVLLIAGVGHLIRQKGFDLLIEAFATAGLCEARLVLTGTGPELPELQRLVAERGIGERVHWLGHRDDVIQVLSACDLFVLPSRNEGMANVMLEAMAAGVPAIAADVSGVRTALGGSGAATAGWIVPTENPVALASTLREVAELCRHDPAEVTSRVCEASRRVERLFNVDRMVTEVETILFGG